MPLPNPAWRPSDLEANIGEDDTSEVEEAGVVEDDNSAGDPNLRPPLWGPIFIAAPRHRTGFPPPQAPIFIHYMPQRQALPLEGHLPHVPAFTSPPSSSAPPPTTRDGDGSDDDLLEFLNWLGMAVTTH